MNRQQRRAAIRHAPAYSERVQGATLASILREHEQLRRALCQANPAACAEITRAFEADRRDWQDAARRGLFFQLFKPAIITHQGKQYRVAV